MAFFFETRAEQFAWVCPYIRDGLEQNDLCLYIVNDNSIPAVISRLQNAGIDTDKAQSKGALKLLTKEQSYLKHGLFDPQKMIADLSATLEEALSCGFSGLRASGEMCWALDTPDAILTVRKYEAALHRSFKKRLTGLCQYDVTRFDGRIISDMIRIHPKIIARGRLMVNRHCSSPDDVLSERLPNVSLTELMTT